MQPTWQRQIQVRVGRNAVLGRREFLRLSSLGLGGGILAWGNPLRAAADALRERRMSCILLWMAGGPSQFETFSPKPKHENGGGTKAIATNVSGLHLSENLPALAKVADKLAVVRSMTSKEGSHPRASYLGHTGYLPTPTVQHPTLGSIVARELPDPRCELPAFVQISGGRNGPGASLGGGLLGVDYDPFAIEQPGALPQNAQPTTDVSRYQRRLGLLNRLELDYAASEGQEVVADHRKLYGKAAKMILSEQMRAFNLDQESPATRDAYGKTSFGNGCLLARRLVEEGVSCVEVVSNGWDTHQDNASRVKELCGQIDGPFAALVADLSQRGLLDRTLVLWMGEFGRTPKVNPRDGRDHYPRAFNVALAGAGIRGGQALGETDAGGVEVTKRPIGIQDLMQTVCQALGVNAAKENMSSIGRPIKIVDGGQPVRELLG